MNCSSCGALVPPGKRFCADCGAPLSVACPACGSANALTKKFCGDCGQALPAPPPREQTPATPAAPPAGPAPASMGAQAASPLADRATGAERRQLTVMFCDLVGSTALANRLDPEDWQGVIRGYHAAVATAMAPYEGHVAQLLATARWSTSATRARMKTTPFAPCVPRSPCCRRWRLWSAKVAPHCKPE